MHPRTTSKCIIILCTYTRAHLTFACDDFFSRRVVHWENLYTTLVRYADTAVQFSSATSRVCKQAQKVRRKITTGDGQRTRVTQRASLGRNSAYARSANDSYAARFPTDFCRVREGEGSRAKRISPTSRARPSITGSVFFSKTTPRTRSAFFPRACSIHARARIFLKVVIFFDGNAIFENPTAPGGVSSF